MATAGSFTPGRRRHREKPAGSQHSNGGQGRSRGDRVGQRETSDRAQSHARTSGEVLAALDLGTNNCRLLVARPQGDGFRVIDAFSRIVRLGEGLGSTGVLSDDAMDRTVDALSVCADKMERRRVTLSRGVATQACRLAGNCDVFMDRVRRETGLEIEIISNQEEAELALAGCVPLFDPAIPNALVFDIGGGSTELAWRPADHDDFGQGLAVISIPIGVVTLAERYGGDRFDPKTYDAMIEEVRSNLVAFDEDHGISRRVAEGSVQMVGTSGTVTTLGGLRLNLRRYARDRVDGMFLDFEEVTVLARRLAAQSYRDRAAEPCIGPDRADLVVAGCAILEAICQQWVVGRLRVADRGVREGILFGLLRQAGDQIARP